ncbi:MAG: GntR family transcriptional regulator [Synergistaceae bacterium]|jgi:DNA-binding GntR family transcriptional regulator|nr:GntR family transcriptional regulator [Synergistaceae bacterium]
MSQVIAVEDIRPIRELVYEYLKSAIGTGEIPSGRRLNESELALKLNISRTPIREAIRKLESDGLVEAIPRRGVVVRDVDMTEIIEIYMIRQALEVMAFKAAAERITPKELKKARKYLCDAETLLSKKEFEEYFLVNELFTNVVIKAGHLPKITQLIASYRDQLRRYRKITLSEPHRQQKVIRQHSDILDAIENHDVEKVGDLVFQHLEDALEVCRRNNNAHA